MIAVEVRSGKKTLGALPANLDKKRMSFGKWGQGANLDRMNGVLVLGFQDSPEWGQMSHFNKMETVRYLVTSIVRELGKLAKWLKCATCPHLRVVTA